MEKWERNEFIIRIAEYEELEAGININNEKKNVYTVKSVAKSVKTNGNVIALNLGTEIEFIDTNGWLIKRYNSSSEVKDIILCDGLAWIIYKDKIELISL